MGRFAHLAYTPSVREVQREQGSAVMADRRLLEGDAPEPLTEAEAEFIASRDGFHLSSVSETGWPYIQFRGGPPGFVHVLDERTIGFLDVRGNRQYITTGNVRADGRVALFFMDQARQLRLKLFGHASVRALQDEPELTERLAAVRTPGREERLLVVRVEDYAWNCHQHITPRYSEAELAEALQPVRARMAALEEENRQLRARLAANG
ncbi:putative pyridoxine 5'-phosphate oxidase superfamily flavin-nucleotide-binding protein [Kitasatospora sp. MAA4]|uniref:pyridoxamine 5'-phosphate oxidase family protein n=1 Tax=Kitasatospora sp. MAA4 TaxID=3035093 RepID=UPI0024744FBC|nr:pyridoxamine 5'-phosphate oxidase family protein [Kitasatospora sp. MAA4]MDH6134289.1 putative pyridoxine 5'-phosphate oxidase superfamily flavin-nucleotide-binding protein [Kitasatospora sp. MAA4]